MLAAARNIPDHSPPVVVFALAGLTVAVCALFVMGLHWLNRWWFRRTGRQLAGVYGRERLAAPPPALRHGLLWAAFLLVCSAFMVVLLVLVGSPSPVAH